MTGFQAYLDEVWQSRFLFDEGDQEENHSRNQPFLTFEYAGRDCGPRLRASKYVGFILYYGITIEILPKLFEVHQTAVAFRHLLWWLSCCRSVGFPFTDLLSDTELVDDFPGYIDDSQSRGHAHQLVCDHEPFVYNNWLNQIIKAVAQRLSLLCPINDTHRWLEEVLFTLDEVDEVPFTARDCDSIHLNRFYMEYGVYLNMCRFFLSDRQLPQSAGCPPASFLLPASNGLRLRRFCGRGCLTTPRFLVHP